MDISKFIISSNKSLNDYIINQCNKDIDEYDIDLDNILKKYINFTSTKYKQLFLFIVYKNKKIYTVLSKEDSKKFSRKKIIIEVITRNIKILEKQFGSLPNFFIPFYLSDSHFYSDNSLPFFVEAKPKNKKGILYPDRNYYTIFVKNDSITYDEFKKNVKIKSIDIDKKEDIIYFCGANTGAYKHNIRMKLKNIVDEKNDKKYDIHIEDTYVPMYDFCKYKYLLNLPGLQPWSYRMTKILLMDSLIFDVTIMQTYIIEKNEKSYEDKNEKWIQIYSDYFIAGEDYVEILYDWTESVTSDLEVIKIYDKINELHKYYDNNKDEYIKITNNATTKANIFNNDIFDKTYQYLMLRFIKKQYETNNTNSINKFLDEIIKLDEDTSNQIVNKISNQKDDDKQDIYSDYFIKKIFLDKVLNITDRKYNILSMGEYENEKLNFIYNNIIKKNKDSLFTIIKPYDKNISVNNSIINTQVNYIKSISIDNLLDVLGNINVNIEGYYIIFIFEGTRNKDLLKELIISWNILKYDGIIVVDLYNIIEFINNVSSGNYYYFRTFYDIFKNEILYLKRIGKKVVIKKIDKKKIQEKIPKEIIKTINDYINNYTKYVDINITIPHQKKIKIKWDFLLSDKTINNEKLGYNKKIEEILYKIYFFSDDNYFKNMRFDIRQLYYIRDKYNTQKITNLLIKNYNNISYNNYNKLLDYRFVIKDNIKFITDLLRLNIKNNIYNHIEEYFYYMKENCLKYKKIKIFEIREGFYPKSLSLNKLKLINKKIKFKINIDYPISKNKYKLENLDKLKNNNLITKNIENIIEHKYILVENNLFNFDEIIKLSKKYNNNVNYIHFKLNWKLKNILSNIKKYNIYMLLNLLYLIFCMQAKEGGLTITYLLSPDNALLDYLYILNNYYNEVKLTNFSEARGITIHCNGFREISKSELKDFFTKYKHIYDTNIKNNLNILDMIKVQSIEENTNKKINIKYIDRIISNKINNKLINSFKNYNNNVNNYIFFMDKYINKINNLYDTTNSNTIKKYIFTKIFEEQYITYLNLNTKSERKLYDFYKVCS